MLLLGLTVEFSGAAMIDLSEETEIGSPQGQLA